MLEYIGKGAWIPGIPAQDLDDTKISELAEIFHLGEKEFIDLLIERGLYILPRKAKKPKQEADPAQDIGE